MHSLRTAKRKSGYVITVTEKDIILNNRFTRILGNSDTKLRLCDAIVKGTLPHALLVVGPEGSGKRTLATEIAAAANCFNAEVKIPGTKLPCGACTNCKRIYSGSFPDVSILSRSSGKATIGVEELRDFREDMFLSATESKYKFYIIEDANLMTPTAQNALLKVLEEPPSSVHIILLCTEADMILSTIKSRTQYVQTELFPLEELRRHTVSLSETAASLERRDPDGFKAILLAAGGVIGKALDMLDEGRSENLAQRRENVMKFISALPKREPFSKLYSATVSLPAKREELKSTFEDIRNALRDLIAKRVSDDIAPIFFLSSEELESTAASLGQKRLIEIYDIISSAIADIDNNVVISTLLTDLAVRIKS